MRRLDKPTQFLEQIQRDTARRLAQTDTQFNRAQVIKKGVPIATKWWTKRKRKLARAAGDTAKRAEVETKERARWIEHLIEVLKKSKMPTWTKAQQCADPIAALRYCAGNSRARQFDKGSDIGTEL